MTDDPVTYDDDLDVPAEAIPAEEVEDPGPEQGDDD